MFCAGCGNTASRGKSTVRIGVGLYRSDDTFINNLRRELEQYAKEYEQESGTRAGHPGGEREPECPEPAGGPVRISGL